MDGATPASRWRRCLPALALLAAALLGLYRDTALGMVAIWLRSDSYAHALLVPPIVIWLVWRQRAQLRLLAPRLAPWALLPLAAGATVWMAGDLVWVNGLSQFAFTALLVLLVPLLLGPAVTRALLFPLGFLFFMVPAGEFLLPPFMGWTADVTVLALRASGIPVYREGLQFVIPSGPWSVAEACSGLRYLIASLFAGTLFAYLSYSSIRRRLVFIAAAVAVPLLANWLRAYLIVMTAHHSGNRLAVGADHLIYGWVFFGLVMGPLFWIGARWAQPARPLSPVQMPSDTASASGAATWALTAAAVLLLALPHAVLRALDADASPAAAIGLPAALAGDWRDHDDATDWRPAFRDPSAEARRSYGAAGRVVGVHLASYRQQSAARKLLGPDNGWVAADDGAWQLLDAGTRARAGEAGGIGGPEPATVRTATLRGPANQRLLAWQLYAADDRFTASALQARVWIARQRLQGRGDEAAALTIFTLQDPQDNSAARAEATLDAFLRDNGAALAGFLQVPRALPTDR